MAPPGLQAKGQDGEWKVKARVPQFSRKTSKTDETDHVKAVNADDGWEEIEFALDSRDTQTVVGEDVLSSVEIKEGAASKRGVEYEITTGQLIPNLGEKKFHAFSQEGVTRSITAQVCAVNQAMVSVKKVMRAGNRVVFDEAETYIEDKVTRERIWATDDGGMFMVKMWVNRKAGSSRQESWRKHGIHRADGNGG